LQRSRFDKTARLLAQAARFEAGQVHLPREAPWLGAYLSELLAFPTGRNDDQVDATAQAACGWADSPRSAMMLRTAS
jgi:predicted phage terminase large subunit-like protein